VAFHLCYNSYYGQQPIQSLLHSKAKPDIENNKIILTKAWKAAPNGLSANAALAELYLRNYDLESAAIYHHVLQQNHPNDPITKRINALKALYQGEYKNACALFQAIQDRSVAADEGFDDNKVDFAIALLADGRTLEAARLAGWPQDCLINSVAHADCMKQLADWHGEVASIEESLQRCLVSGNKALHHRKRQLIFLGEALKNLLRGIEENDGLVRTQLIEKYEIQKRQLARLHAQIIRMNYLDKEKITDKQLAKSEKKIKPS